MTDIALLSTTKEATLLLHGKIGGPFGAIWQVLLPFKRLLRHFQELRQRYPCRESLQQGEVTDSAAVTALNTAHFDDSNRYVAEAISTLPADQMTFYHHLSTNINLVWQKPNEYYAKLDDSPIFVACNRVSSCYDVAEATEEVVVKARVVEVTMYTRWLDY